MAYVYEELLLELDYSISEDETIKKLSDWCDELDFKIIEKWENKTYDK